MRALWEEVEMARHPELRGVSAAVREAVAPSVRLGVGGARSGVAFHLHEPALNHVFYGAKASEARPRSPSDLNRPPSIHRRRLLSGLALTSPPPISP